MSDAIDSFGLGAVLRQQTTRHANSQPYGSGNANDRPDEAKEGGKKEFKDAHGWS